MYKLLFLFLFISIPFSVFADDFSSDEEDSKITIKGTGYIMFGMIDSGYSHLKMGEKPINNHWQNFYSGRVDVFSEPNEWFKTHIGLEVSSSFPILKETTIMKTIFKTSQKPVLPVASGMFNFDFDDFSLEIETGLMEYAFNTEVKNLGNYMYRTSAYPMNIRTKLDYIYTSLFGVRAQTGLFNDQLKFSILMNSIIDLPPFFDMDFGLFASYANESKLIDVGLGIMFERFIAINDTLTDCILQKRNFGADEDTNATLRGTKIDARATFDVKQLFGDIDMFGPNDAKIYLEAAVLGLKDWDFYNYEENPIFPKTSIMNRIPFLFGVNIPTFKILDLLSAEFEYCAYPYAMDWWGKGPTPTPKPEIPIGSSESDSTWRDIYKTRDNLKWTFYLKKSFSKFDIIGMIANDHVMYETFAPESHSYTEQSLKTDKDMHWYIKLQYHL